MFDAFFQGLVLVFQWPAIGFVVVGTLLGIWLSAVPGLGGIIGIVVLLPFTFAPDEIAISSVSRRSARSPTQRR